jgi:leader peptidase (prepilin peptidase)/N-methyltransferase
MLSVWLVLVFLLGACIGGLLNVCIQRLPYEKSLLWPGWRCTVCYQPIRWYDAAPLAGFWLRLGRCRACGARFPARYFVIELLTGLCFTGLFYLDVVVNVHGLATLSGCAPDIAAGRVPWQAWVVFGHHALLVSFLLLVSLIDLDHYEIPLPITVLGTMLGLASSALWAWPWPDAAAPLPVRPALIVPGGLGLLDAVPQPGLYPWPVWFPLPEALAPAGSWKAGLATGLVGALVGTMLLRGVRFLFGLGRGREGLGVGDADLMMMAGSFLGWQPIVVAFFVSVFPALLVGLVQIVVRGSQELAFGPSLSLGIVLTMLAWPAIGPKMAFLFFDGTLIGLLVLAGGAILFIASVLLRLLRGPGGEDEPVQG